LIFWDITILCKIFADVISVGTGWWHLVVRQFELFSRRAAFKIGCVSTGTSDALSW